MAILHKEGQEFLCKVLKGSANISSQSYFYVGLGNWSPTEEDGFANISGEPSGYGYNRQGVIAQSLFLEENAEGFRLLFTCSFSADGGDWTRVKQIFITDSNSKLLFTIRITADMIREGAGLDWNSSTGLLIPDGCTFTPKYNLFISNKHISDGGGVVYSKPSSYDTPLNSENGLTEGIIFCSWMLPDADGQACEIVTDVSGNDLHGIFDNFVITGNAIVSGAGSSEYNQEYIKSTKTLYISEDGDYKLVPTFMGDGWCLLPFSADPMDGCAYYSDSADLYAGTWYVYGYPPYGGSSPVPTLTEGAVPDGPWTEDGLQFTGGGAVDLSNSAILNPQIPTIPVSVSNSAVNGVNGNYIASGSTYVHSDTGDFKILLHPMAWPEPYWILVPSDWMEMDPVTHQASDGPTNPWDANWSGVTVEEGEDPSQPGDPTGMTIHILLKINTPSTNTHWVSRWHGSSGAECAYVIEKYNGGVPQSNVWYNKSVRDVLGLQKDQIVSLTWVWDGVNQRLYRDGVQVTVNLSTTAIQETTGKTVLGAYYNGSTPASCSDDEFRLVSIWKRPLSSEEVKSLADNPYQLAEQ